MPDDRVAEAIIEKSVDLDARPDRVWQALTDHREFGAWFRVDLDGPFVTGQTTTGRITHPGAVGMPFEATVVEMDPPRRFAFTWPHVDPDTHAPLGAETRVEFTLEPLAGGTRLTVRESGFEALPLARRDKHRRMNDGGWEIQMRYIADYLAAAG